MVSGKSSRRILFPQVCYFVLSCNCFTLLACICLFKVNNGNTRMSTLNRFQAFFDVSIVDFEQINAGRDITIMQSICVHMFLRNGYSGKYWNQSKLPVMATFLVLFNEAELYLVCYLRSYSEQLFFVVPPEEGIHIRFHILCSPWAAFVSFFVIRLAVAENYIEWEVQSNFLENRSQILFFFVWIRCVSIWKWQATSRAAIFDKIL